MSLDIPAGSKVLVLSPNGAGKTTLLRAIAGLITPKAGKIDVRATLGSKWKSKVSS